MKTFLIGILLLLVCISPALSQEQTARMNIGMIGAGGCDTLTDSRTTNDGYQHSMSDLATGFVAGSNYTLCKIEVALYINSGTPSGVITAYIYDDSSTSPGSVIATSTNTVDPTTLPGPEPAYDWYTFNFSGVSLTNGTRYWIVLDITANWTIGWRLDNGDGHWAYGTHGSTWTVYYTDKQGMFKTYK